MNLIKRKNGTGGHTGRDLTRPSSMLELRSELDDLVGRFFHEPWGFGGRLGSLGLPEPIEPAIDVSETDTHMVVRAEIPGIEPDRIDVSVTERSVTISGNKEETREHEGENVFRSERRFGAFQRMIPLPSPVDPEGVDARFKNGVLRIEMAKATPSHSRRIAVKAD